MKKFLLAIAAATGISAVAFHALAQAPGPHHGHGDPIAMIAALASYDSADPSFNVATGRDVGNWLGGTGAYASDFLFQMFGLAALAFVATVGAWGWQTLTGKRQTHPLKPLIPFLAA